MYPTEGGSSSALSGKIGSRATMTVGVGSLVYSAAFVVAQASDNELARYVAATSLLIGGLLGIVVAVTLFIHLGGADRGIALCAVIFGAASGLGSSIHGGFDLAGLINPPTATIDFANPVDPRGMLTFGVAAFAILGWSLLMAQSSFWPARLVRLGYLSATLLVIVYLGRLIALDPENPLLIGPAALEGIIVNPLWFLWTGRLLLEDSVRQRVEM